MTEYFPIIIEKEDNGTLSAWVAGVDGVYASAGSAAQAKRGIRTALAAHFDTLMNWDGSLNLTMWNWR